MELKKCPFCGGTESLVILNAEEDYLEGVAVCCSAIQRSASNEGFNGCGATCGYQRTEEEAIKAWNNREDR